MNNMKKILDPKNLPYFGAMVQAVLFSIAGDKFFSSFGWLAGLGLGAVVNWSMAVASSRVSNVAKGRKALAYISLIGLFCLSPVIICSTLGWSLANFSWSIAADLSILLTGAIVGKGLISEEKPSATKSDASATDSAKSARKVRRTATDSAKSATHSVALRRTYPRKCEHCDGQIESPNAVGAHMKKHHPELCKPKVLAEVLFAGAEK